MSRVLPHGRVPRPEIFEKASQSKVLLMLSRDERFGMATVPAGGLGDQHRNAGDCRSRTNGLLCAAGGRRGGGSRSGGLSAPSRLQRARNHLHSSDLAFGITERFDEELIYLKWRLGWPLQPLYRRTNTGYGQPTKEEVPPRIRKLIRNQNRLDPQLYEEATKLSKVAVKAISGFEEVRQF